jgi:X-Pro dipeptidyl-peptidase
MSRFGGKVAILALATLGFGGTAQAAEVTIGSDGRTAPVFDYTQAIRERVFIPQPGVDQDGNGKMDFVTADIIRPRTDVEVPAIIDPSPYYTTVCRGNESQCMAARRTSRARSRSSTGSTAASAPTRLRT